MKNLFNSKTMICLGALTGGLSIGTLTLAHSDDKSKPDSTTSNDHLFKIGVALLQYSDDYDGKLPPMSNVAEVKESLEQFAMQDVLIQPENNQPYQPNPLLSCKMHSGFNGKKVVAFYEANPRNDGTRIVLFLPFFDKKIVHYESNSAFVKEGIQRLSKDEWLRVKPTGAK